MTGRARFATALVAALALLLLPLTGTAMADTPTVKLSTSQAGTGGSLTVTGTGWRPRALLMILICGQSVPSRGVPGGTNSCANADGRAVTTDAEGRFSRQLPVTEPPVPCPCVVHVATVTGAKAEADAVFQVAGHPVEPLPEETGGGRVSVLTDTRLEGSSGLLTWFGAPPSRTLVLTVGNVGTGPVKDPVFQIGTSHGVFAPQWQEQQWRGTLAPGGKARVKLPVELAAGAHGDYTVSLKYGGKVLAEQPWGVGRPWGVTLFWILLCVVVPTALFRIGMAVVDRVRPRHPGSAGGRRQRPDRRRSRTPRLPERTLRLPRSGAADGTSPTAGTLPWFTPDSDPGTVGRLPAQHIDKPHEEMPHDDKPHHYKPHDKPHDDSPTSPTTPTRKGPM
ncbi:hypothetical protein ACGFNV_11855 [Streptomyces sp. NPDC048751]|uniref:hypothetical protein n=1 Tax=Streptomyces sp. NPDC048751 TaxID=3365591 RepID=UPI003719AD20